MNSMDELDMQDPYFKIYEDVMAAGAPDLGVYDTAALCCDNHPPDALALLCMSPDGSVRSHTFGELRDMSCRFANLLRRTGVRPGDTVAGLLPRGLEMVVTLLGTMRLGAIYQPLFTAFGPKAVAQRVRGSQAALVVTDAANRDKLSDLDVSTKVMCVGAGANGDVPFAALQDEAGTFLSAPRKADDPMLVLFTSGTTGQPKGVRVPCKAVHSFLAYMKYAVDLRAEDRYWNLADPGWAYGLYYGVIGPMLLGLPVTFFSGGFTPQNACDVVEQLGITNLAGAPTAFRMLVASGDETSRRLHGRLRVVSSAGEALNAEVIRWFDERLGCPVHDHYGQTEGGMLLANHHALRHSVVPGSAGFALPGIRAVVIDGTGQPVRADTPGELCIDSAGSPLYWFDGYWSAESGQAAHDRYHRTGDLVKMSDDGRVTFVGRADDVITSSGYRIGPFDVESTLMEHPAVAEVAVIGKPDPERTEIVKAFVVLKPDQCGSAALTSELQALVKRRLSAHAYPRDVEYVQELPKTPSGKIQRFVLRDREAARQRVVEPSSTKAPA